MAPQWNQALVRIASAKDPAALPTTDSVLFFDDRTITIYDKFAKACYHFLVLPRIPFRLSTTSSSSSSASTLSASNGKLNFGSTTSNSVPASHMKSISSLLASPYSAEVLDAVHKASDRVLDHIRSDMLEKYGTTWEIERAFHAVPSMEHLHLHVVSMDLVSDRLKHKKHYLSFHPTLGFALRLKDVEEWVREGKKKLPKSEKEYEGLLKGQLMSHHTGQVFRIMPELKAHLEACWRTHILQAGAGKGGEEGAGASVKRTLSNVEPGSSSTDAGLKDQQATQRRKTELESTEKEADAKDQRPSDSDDEPSLPMR